jgi:hypothetical protein
MATIEQLPHCCGIEELGYIRDDDSPEDTLMSVEYHDLPAHFVFSVTSVDSHGHRMGHALAKYIEANKLVTVVTSPASKNPGHDGTLKAWIWTPAKAQFRRWQTRMKKKNPDRYRYHNPYYNPYGAW